MQKNKAALDNCDAIQKAHPDLEPVLNTIRREINKSGLYNFYEDTPPSKFVALYSDGSGCDLFYEVEEGFYSSPEYKFERVQADWFADAGYLWFMPLPDGFEIWGGNNA